VAFAQYCFVVDVSITPHRSHLPRGESPLRVISTPPVSQGLGMTRLSIFTHHRTALFLGHVIAFVVPTICLACDSATICSWKRTWNAPYPLRTPLRGYFVPRLPGQCDYEDCAGTWGCAASASCDTPARIQAGGMIPHWMYPPESGIGFDPVQFERLGQIPNDFELEGVPPGGPRSPQAQ
jgi:hypothetical protein